MFKKIIIFCSFSLSLIAQENLDLYSAIKESDLEAVQDIFVKSKITPSEKFVYFDLACSIANLRKERIQTAEIMNGFGQSAPHSLPKGEAFFYRSSICASFLLSISCFCKGFSRESYEYQQFIGYASAIAFFILIRKKKNSEANYREALYDNALRIKSLIHTSIITI